jgi:DNA-binding transcriptional regulator GbsR (MarR family)
MELGHQPNVVPKEAEDRFIASWGKMAGAWGISRTMAEVHALLYISGRAMFTDEIMERLQISRGNASMSLRALLDWGIVVRSNKRGDRKEYFAAEADVWTLFRMIVRERLRREVDPLLAELHEIRDVMRKDTGEHPHHARIESMLEFFTLMSVLGQQFVSPSGSGLRAAATLLTTQAGKEPG